MRAAINRGVNFLDTAFFYGTGRSEELVGDIDLFYIYVPDQDTPKDEAVGVLKQLKDEGKIRAIGVSNFSLEQLKEANKVGYVDVLQGNYNLLQREAEQEFFPYTTENNAAP